MNNNDEIELLKRMHGQRIVFESAKEDDTRKATEEGGKLVAVFLSGGFVAWQQHTNE